MPTKTKSATKTVAKTTAKVAKESPVAEATENRRSTWQKISQKAGRFILNSSAPEVMLVASLAMARYIKNSDFSYPSEIVLNIVLIGLFVSAVYYAVRAVLKDRLAAHITSLLLAYAAYGFSYSFVSLRGVINALVPDSVTWFEYATMSFLILALVFGLLGYALSKIVSRVSFLRGLPILKFVVFVVAFVFVSQLAKVGLRVWEIKADLAYKQPVSVAQKAVPVTKVSDESKPNIYYLMFDRYANDKTLEDIYKYDNSEFASFLSGQGFVKRSDAYANYPYTMMSASSTLAMRYHADLGKEFKYDAGNFQAAFPYRKILDNPPLVQMLKSQGYKYNHLSSWWDFTRGVPSADSEPTRSFELRFFGKSFWLTDLQRDIFGKSVLSPMLQKGLTLGDAKIVKYQNDRNPVQNFNDEMDALEKIAKDSGVQTKPHFTFAHILSPHDPYIFDEKGKHPTYNQDRTDIGIDEAEKYTNQLTYLNTRIRDLITTIRSKDPNAVIVMQADEGPYPKQFRGTLTEKHYYDPINLELPQMRQKFGIQASYYLPGVDQKETAENMNSSVNAFRFVLNKYLGYQLPLLPDCHFTSGNKFKLYNYELVSGKLKGEADPASCAEYK